MENENKDVKPDEANVAPVQEQTEQTEEVSEDVKTPDVVDKNVYEKVREAMKTEREAKRVAEARATELEERIAKLEQTRTTDDYTDYDPYKAKTDILFLMNKDAFVKENLDLIEQKMTDNPSLDVTSAVREVKSDFFDRIQKEVTSVEPNQPLKQEKPTATPEKTRPELTGNVLKDAMEGKIENVPNEQMVAIKRVMGQLGK